MGQIANQMALELFFKIKNYLREKKQQKNRNLQVWYMNGAGNDFMVLDARGLELDFGKLALDLCEMSGADGFMAVDESDKADFKLHFYNADGSRGEMCGNGAKSPIRSGVSQGSQC